MKATTITTNPPVRATIDVVTLYHVTSNTELNEGRGATTTIGWFLDGDLAKRAGAGRYVMGTDCPIEAKPCKVARLEDGTIYRLGERVDVGYERSEDVRKRALDKLTADERKALGLT